MAKFSMWRAAAVAALTGSAAFIAVPAQANSAPSSNSTFEARRSADAARRNADAAVQALGEPASDGQEQSAWSAHLGQAQTEPSYAGQTTAAQPIERYYDREKARAERASLAQARLQQQQAAAAEAGRQQRLAAIRQEQQRRQQAAAAEANRQQRLASVRQQQQQQRAAWQTRQRAVQEAAWRERQQESRWAAREDWRDDSWDDDRDDYRDNYRDDYRDESWDDDREDYRDNRRWDNGWARDPRYDWRNYRNDNRDVYRAGRYNPPYRADSYRSLDIGRILQPLFFGQRYWVGDPWRYRLPQVHGPYRWVRYYDDVLLINIHNGQVTDAIYEFFS